MTSLRNNWPLLVWPLLVWLLAAGLLAILKLGSLGLKPGDEWIYLAGGQELLSGNLPYRDFFLAHPPVRTFLAAAGLVGFGTPFVLMGLELLCALGTSALCGAITAKAAGRAWGLVAALLFLGADVTISFSTNFLAMHAMVLLLVLGWWLLEQERPLAAGFVHCLALNVGLHVAVPVLATGLLLLLPSRRGLLFRYCAGLAMFVPLFALWGLLFGAGFFQQTILYHGSKGEMAGFKSPAEVLAWFLQFDYLSVALSLLALTGLARKQFGPGLRYLAVGWFTLTLVTLFPSIHVYYYLIALPALSIAGGLGIGALTSVTSSRYGRPGLLLLAAVLAVAVIPAQYAVLERQLCLAGSAGREDAETRELLSRLAATAPAGARLFGDSAIVPLASVVAGYQVAGRVLDSNPKRILSGTCSFDEMLAPARAAGIDYYLTVDRHGVGALPEMERLLEQETSPVFTFHASTTGFVYRLWKNQAAAR